MEEQRSVPDRDMNSVLHNIEGVKEAEGV